MPTEIQTQPAFSAFEKQLKTLCLREFPCGAGTWRQNSTDDLSKLKNTAKVEHRFSITLKDFGAQNEKTETLEEYVGSAKSPWHLDYSWSQEAKQLREISVKSPWLIDDNFVLNHFKTLRIVSKDVTYIDSNLLKFKNLEELTLSCNRISQIDSRNLPSSLKVLEVCANEVSDLASLCEKPPALIHLGLGYNKLSIVGDYLTGQYWPQLLSLDLSNNDLSDLLDVVRKLSSLPKLRNLVLQGNPLSLIPGYRGYTVDSLRKLSILDDIMISADERHYFKGLARRREYILDEAKVKLGITYIKGIPVPDEIKNPEDQPEFPVIERKYFVQFMFLEDATLKYEGGEVTERDEEMGEINELSGLPTDRTDLSQTGEQSMNIEDQSMIEKNVIFTEEPDITHTIDNTGDTVAQEPETKEEKVEEKTEPEIKTIQLAPLDSEKHVWGEEIECNWSQMVVRDDLLSLRDFFKQGMNISVVEEVTLSYPIIPEEGDEGAAPNPKRKGSSRMSQRQVSQSRMSQASKTSKTSKRSSRKSVEGHLIEPDVPATRKSSAKGSRKGSAKSNGKDKKKEKDDKTKSGGKEKGGNEKKKKKGEPEQELKKSPPTYTTLATWHVPLAEFLEGEFDYQSVFTQGGVEVASTVRSVDSARRGLKSRASGRGSSRVSRRDSSTIGELPIFAASRMGFRSRSSLGAGSRRASRSSRSGLLDDKKADPKDKNKKPTSAGKKKDDKDKSKDRKPSASKTSKDAKGGDKGKGGGGKGAPAPVVDEDEDTGPPPPLEIQLSVQLHHWKTAMDLLKDEEAKNKQQEPVVETV